MAVPMMHILDNDFMLVFPGSTWELENADHSTVNYPTLIADEDDALEKEGFMVNPKLWDFYNEIPNSKMRKDAMYAPATSQQYESPWADYT